MSKADSIKARLRALAVQADKPYEYIQTHYFIERILFRLSKSQFANDFVLKGGLLLYAIFENRSRATRDIDFLAQQINNAPETMIDVFKVICAIPSDDAVTYDLSTLTAQRITEDAEYPGVRIKVMCYLDRSRSALQFDIGFGDIVIPSPQNMIYPSVLNMDEARLLVYSKESVIAEKLHAMIYLAMANSRMKDFYDIALLAESFDFDGQTLYAAIDHTLRHRATPMAQIPVVFTDEFFQDATKLTQWAGFSKRINNEASAFPDVLLTIRYFLQPIYNAILDKADFAAAWNHDEKVWKY